MYNADRRSKEFIDGLHYFLSVAEANKQNGFMCCPCVHCNNNKDYSSSRILHSHIFANGFMEKYVCWTKHGEQGVTMEDNEEEDFDDHFPGNAGIGAFDDDIPMEEPEVDVAENDPSDDLGQALHNVQADCESETERLKFQKLLEDHHKLLYPDCQNGFKKLGTTLELLQWKATNGVSDKGFDESSLYVPSRHVEHVWEKIPQFHRRLVSWAGATEPPAHNKSLELRCPFQCGKDYYTFKKICQGTLYEFSFL